jgi:threonine synthase
MFSVQASGCAPIVRAFVAGDPAATEFPDAHTCASGLRVPKAVGDFLMLRILRESKGGAIEIDDAEMLATGREVGAAEGMFVAPEGAACFAALRKLRERGEISADEEVVIFNTGAGIKYLECFA